VLLTGCSRCRMVNFSRTFSVHRQPGNHLLRRSNRRAALFGQICQHTLRHQLSGHFLDPPLTILHLGALHPTFVAFRRVQARSRILDRYTDRLERIARCVVDLAAAFVLILGFLGRWLWVRDIDIGGSYTAYSEASGAYAAVLADVVVADYLEFKAVKSVVGDVDAPSMV